MASMLWHLTKCNNNTIKARSRTDMEGDEGWPRCVDVRRVCRPNHVNA